MNRRSFLQSTVAVGSLLALRRSTLAESAPQSAAAPSTEPTLMATQADRIRTAASQLLQTLTPERRDRMTFAFPTGQTPTAVGFSQKPPGFGGPRNAGGPGAPGFRHHDVAFDVEGRPKPDDGSGGPGGPHGPGGPGGPNDHGPGDHGPGGPRFGLMVAGEKFGDAVRTNFPVSIVARPGVQMGELTAAERSAATALLQAVLSPMGYQKLLDVMTADQIVADAGADYAAGLNVYTMGLFGQPSASNPWMLQFGGHHLGLNVVFVRDQAVCAPLHTGILPARFAQDGQIIRGLGRENDKAFDLLATFTSEQRHTATIDHNLSDLVFGPGHPDAQLMPQGLRGSEMTELQRTMLLSLAGEWAGVLNDAHSGPRLEAIRQSLSDTHFAWSGPTTNQPGYEGGAYFRIHGPRLLIEHAPQGNQGGYKVHVHTVMRELGNDYAKRLV